MDHVENLTVFVAPIVIVVSPVLVPGRATVFQQKVAVDEMVEDVAN